MENIYKPFFTSSYQKTRGFTPVIPYRNQVLPGDFFKIEHGEVNILGNIFKDSVINPKDVVLEYNIPQHREHWQFDDGLRKPFFGRKERKGDFEEEDRNIKRFEFASSGSFFFNAKDPKSVKIQNWHHIEDKMTLKMTQVLYSFRELYVVTESAYLDEWVLGVANEEEAELEVMVKIKEDGAGELFGASTSKAIFAKHMECYLRNAQTSFPFFKAKKLCMRSERDRLASFDAIRGENAMIGWADNFFDFEFRIEDDHRNSRYGPISLIDGLRANELNPTTALEFFHWVDFSLDDIEMLFACYG